MNWSHLFQNKKSLLLLLSPPLLPPLWGRSRSQSQKP